MNTSTQLNLERGLQDCRLKGHAAVQALLETLGVDEISETVLTEEVIKPLPTAA